MTISTVTSEALQLKLRQLLPSQQGFGTDLSASDTIIPVIDLTAAAEGSDVSETLQQAIAYGSQTNIASSNQTVTVANTTGFYRVIGTAYVQFTGNLGRQAAFYMTDGVAPKLVWGFKEGTAYSPTNSFSVDFDLVFYLPAGISLEAITSIDAVINGSVRQIADNNGTLVQPAGFNPQ